MSKYGDDFIRNSSIVWSSVSLTSLVCILRSQSWLDSLNKVCWNSSNVSSIASNSSSPLEPKNNTSLWYWIRKFFYQTNDEPLEGAVNYIQVRRWKTSLPKANMVSLSRFAASFGSNRSDFFFLSGANAVVTYGTASCCSCRDSDVILFKIIRSLRRAGPIWIEKVLVYSNLRLPAKPRGLCHPYNPGKFGILSLEMD